MTDPKPEILVPMREEQCKRLALWLSHELMRRSSDGPEGLLEILELLQCLVQARRVGAVRS